MNSRYLQKQRDHLRKIDDSRSSVRFLRSLLIGSALLLAGAGVAWFFLIRMGFNSIGNWDAGGVVMILGTGLVFLTAASGMATFFIGDELIGARSTLLRAERNYEDFCMEESA